MTSTLERMTGTPREIELRGKRYMASPITIGDLAAFRQYLRAEALKAALRVLADEKDREAAQAKPEEQALIRRKKDQEAQALYPRFLYEAVPEGLERAEMNSAAGTIFLLWRAVKRNNPAITIEEISDLIGLDNLAEAKKQVDKLIPHEPGTEENEEADPSGSRSPGESSAGSSSESTD